MAAHDPPPDPRRIFRSRVLTGLTLALVAGWAWFAAPTAIGGPATYVVVSGTSMQPTLHPGDLVVTTTESRYRRGDVVVFTVPKGNQAAGEHVVHRIVDGDAAVGFVTRGDNRNETDSWRPHANEVLGRVRLQVPAGGRIMAFLLSPVGFAVLAAIATFIAISAVPPPRTIGYRPRHAARRQA